MQNSLSGRSLRPQKAAGPQWSTSPLTLLAPHNSAQEKGQLLKSITRALLLSMYDIYIPLRKSAQPVTRLLQNFPTALCITCMHIPVDIFIDLFKYVYVLNWNICPISYFCGIQMGKISILSLLSYSSLEVRTWSSGTTQPSPNQVKRTQNTMMPTLHGWVTQDIKQVLMPKYWEIWLHTAPWPMFCQRQGLAWQK